MKKNLWLMAVLAAGMTATEAMASDVRGMETFLEGVNLEEYSPVAVQDNVGKYVSQRPKPADRLFKSDAVEKKINEIKECIQMLMKTDAGTGFMHESFHKDNPKVFTREWFAWQNTLFGELIIKLVNDGKLDLLNSISDKPQALCQGEQDTSGVSVNTLL